MSDVTQPKEKGGFTWWKLTRWLVLGAMAIVVFLMLKKPQPVADPMTPAVAKERSDQVQSKMADLESAHQHGEPAEARFSSEEINGLLQQAQAGRMDPSVQAGDQRSAGESPQEASNSSEPDPEITTTRIGFEGDHAVGQFVVRGPAGKEIYLTITGKIKADDGYASFEFTEGKIGDMPIPVALLNPRLQAKLQEPEIRPKLKLPAFVADIHVENGELVMREK